MSHIHDNNILHQVHHPRYKYHPHGTSPSIIVFHILFYFCVFKKNSFIPATRWTGLLQSRSLHCLRLSLQMFLLKNFGILVANDPPSLIKRSNFHTFFSFTTLPLPLIPSCRPKKENVNQLLASTVHQVV